MSLTPLGPESTRELLADLAGGDPSIDGLAELIHERTGGNPFFIEEVVRELVEAGNLEGERGAYRLTKPVEDTGVPATVQAILAARIDRLAAAKALLQAAAVIGKEVPEPALRIVSGLDDEALAEGLKELIGAGFLYEAEIYPERVLAFSHPLTREVAYGSQLGEQRATAHAATARAMIELDPDRHDELAALIAQHLEQGGETLEAARWNARAAHWAGYSHPQDAIRLWGKVTELASELPESEETAALGVFSRLLQLDYAWRLGMEKERVDALVEEAREIAARTGDLRSLTLLRFLESARPGLDQHTSEWTRAVDEAIALADESGDDALRVAIRTAGSYSYMVAGDLDHCEQLLDEALEIAGDDHSAGNGIVIGCPYAWAIMGKGIIRRDRCRVRRRRGAVREGPADRGRAGRPRDRGLDPRQPRRAAGGAGRPRFGPRARPAELRAHRAPRGRLLEGAGRWSTSGSCGWSAGTRRMPSRPSSAATASTARRWARAARPRPGGRR